METAKKLPWYQRVHRWGQTNLTEDDPATCDLEFWKKQWKRTRVQGVIINCGGIVAYYPSKFGMQYRAAMLGDKDYFGEFNAAAREAGLAVIARMDINRATKEFFDAHPDWFCRDRDGTPMTQDGRYFSCINSGYYKEYIPAVLQEIIERYHPDGFSDNSWKGLTRKQICYCGNCRSRFRLDCGEELPEKENWDDPVYRKWIRWSYQCRLDNWDLFNETTKKYGGEDCLWLGMLNADIAGSAVSFADLKALCSRSKVIFSDHQSREPISGFEQNALNGSLFKMASEENVVVLESMANYVRGHRAFRLAAAPAQEVRSWMEEGFAGGISPWFHHISGGQRDKRQFETPVPLFQWHEQNEHYLYDRENMADVAVVWNQQNFDFYGRDQIRERCEYPWNGTCLALSGTRIPFIPVHADDLGRYRDRIHTLVLPDIAILSDEQQNTICQMLDAGVNLVMTGNTATLDGDGMPLSRSPLWEKLGLQQTEQFHGDLGDRTADWSYFGKHNYLLLPHKRHPVLNGFADTEILAYGGGFEQVVSNGPLQQIAGYIPPFPIYPPEFSWVRETHPEVGTIFAGTLESGARAVYFAADIDRCFGRERLPDHRKLLENAVRYAAGDAFPVTVSGSGQINVTIYRQQTRRIIHLVNLTGGNVSPGYCEEIFPVGPVTLTLPADSTNYRVQMTVSHNTPSIMQNGSQLTITIPRLGNHEMVVIDPV